jgi:3-hydroxyisobutyrate dehydrogenase-like beta-hydroxyacid dehydrogenase
MMAQPTLGFIGAGKVGTTLARLLFARGFVIPVLYSSSTDHAENLAVMVRARVATSAEEVTASTDLTFLTVPDW